MKLPPVMRAAWVHRPQDEAFDVFVHEIGAWWPLPTHGLFGDESASVCFRDGLLVEQSVNGTESVWGEIVTWEPPNRLVVAWHPGREVHEASEVSVVFEADGSGTRVTIEHQGWGIFGEDGLSRRRGYVGPGAWGSVLDHYGDGAEVRPDAADLSALAAAYDEFFAEAERADVGPGPQGEWNAEQTIAHVTLNDAAMLAVCHGLVHQNPVRFENEVSQDRDVLGAYITSVGDLTELVERGRHTANLVLAALQRLSPDQRASEVHCCLRHDGVIMLDRAVPWEGVAIDTQAAVHLRAHVDQLRDLRVSLA